MQLEHIRLQRLDDVRERGVVGVNRERDFCRAALCLQAELTRTRETQMAGRWPKEHETSHVRASIQRSLERLGR